MNQVDKRLFLVVSGDEKHRALYTKWIETHISNASVSTAKDGQEALFRVENQPPAVIVTELDLAKINGLDLVHQILKKRTLSEISIIILSPLPDEEHFVTDVVKGRVQFLVDRMNEEKFNACLVKALNRVSRSKDLEFWLHFLTAGEVLFREGEKAESAFIVKKGKLFAYTGEDQNPTALGEVFPGEFVGEMAHINKEPRSATVKAIDDCELIEIPNDSLDLVLFSKPVWAQALMRTLSKRLKRSNDAALKTK